MKKALYTAIGTLAGLMLGYLIFSSGQVEDGMQSEAALEGHSHTGAEVWTCSMHPQILQPEPGDCPLCGMELIPAGADDSQRALNQIRMTENAMLLADIRTSRVGEAMDSMDGSMTLSGRIVENEEANRVQASYFDGRIEQLYATFEGQQIQVGQPLATLYAPDLVAAQQELLTTAPLKESQPNLYRAVRNKLRNWKLTDTQIDKIEKAGAVMETFPVYANVSGTVTELMAAEGDYVKAGQPIARLSNLSTVWAELDAFESQLEELRIGQEIEITINAYPDLKIPAQISFINPVLESAKRTVSVRAVLQNSNGRLKPGMFVSARIAMGTQTREVPLTIPTSAVMWTGERSLVYVKPNPNQPVFEMREVVLGSRFNDRFMVSSGLQAGEVIVTHGTFTVDAAAQLQGKSSMMNKERVEFPPAATDPLGERFVSRLGVALQSYLDLKDALVQSDSMAARANAIKMAENLPSQDLVTHPDHDLALGEMRKELNALAKGGSLSEQRRHFQLISENLILMARPLGSTDQPIYLQYCPMANQNKGAYWLSMESEVKNPYYGEAMLKCGEVRATWSGSH